MSVSRLPNGRWRAQIADSRRPKGGRPNSNVSVAGVIGGNCPRSFATKEEAKQARAVARKILNEWHEAHPRPLVKRVNLEWRAHAKNEESCRNCGDTKRQMHLHHIVPKGVNPEGKQDIEGNGLPLCTRCHYGWHHRVIEIPHDIFTDKEFLAVLKLAGTAWIDRHYPGSESVAKRRTRLMSGEQPVVRQLRLVS